MTPIEDVEAFLTAYVLEAARQDVELISGAWGRPESCHCLVSDMACRSAGGYVRLGDGMFSPTACISVVSGLLGVPEGKVRAIVDGWDDEDDPSTTFPMGPFHGVGGRVRAAYLAAVEARAAELRESAAARPWTRANSGA